MASPVKPGDDVSTPQKPAGTPSRKTQLENMPHDELVQYTMKHMLFLQKLKAKCDDIQKKSGEEIEELKKALENEKQKSVTLADSKTEVEQHLNDANKKISSKDEELDCLKMKQETLLISMQSFQNDYDKLKKELRDSKEQVSSLLNQITENDKSIEETLANAETDSKTVESLRQENKSLSTELSALKITISSLKEKNKADSGKVNKEIETFKALIEKLHQEIKEKGEQLSNTKFDLQNVTEESKLEIDNLNKLQSNMKVSLKQKDDEISLLTTKLEHTVAEMREAKTESNDGASEIETLKGKLCELENSLQVSQAEKGSTIKQLEEENARLSENLKTLSVKHSELEAAFETTNNQLNQAIKTAQIQNEVKEGLETKYSEAQSAICALEKDLRLKNEELTAQRKQSIAGSDSIENLEKELSGLRSDIEFKQKSYETDKVDLLDQVKKLELEKTNMHNELSAFVNLVQPSNEVDPYAYPLAKQYITIINEELMSKENIVSESKQENTKLVQKLSELESQLTSLNKGSNNEASLVARLKEQTGKVSELLDSNKNLASQLETKSKNLERTEEKLTGILSQLEDASKKLTAVEKEKLDLSDNIKSMKLTVEANQQNYSNILISKDENISKLMDDLKSENLAKTNLEKKFQDYETKVRSEIEMKTVKIAQHEKEFQLKIEDLTAKNKNLSRLNEATSEELQNANKVRDELKTLIEKQKKSIDELESKIENNNQTLSSTIKTHAHNISDIEVKYEGHINELKDKMLVLQNTVDGLQQVIKEKENMIIEITDGNKNQSAKLLEDKNAQMKALQGEVSEMENKIQKHISEKESFLEINKALEKKCNEINQELQQLQSISDTLQNEKQTLCQQKAEFNKSHQHLSSEYEIRQNQINDLEQIVASLNESSQQNKKKFDEIVAIKDTEHEKLNEEVLVKEKNIEKLTLELTEKKKICDENEALKQKWEEKRQSLTDQLATFKGKCESYEKQIHEISEAKMEKEILQKSSESQELANLQKSLKTAEDYSNKLKVVAVKAKKELEATKKQVNNLQDEKTNLQSKIESLSQQLQSSSAQASNVQMMQKECDNLQDYLDTITEEKKSIEKSHEDVVNQLKTLQSEKDELEFHFNVSQSKVEALNIEKNDLHDLNTMTKSTVDMLETTRNQLLKERENLKKEIEEHKQSIVGLQAELENEKRRHDETKEKLLQVKKGVKQQDVMTLEMVQYEKTVSDLTMQYEKMEEELKKEANEKLELQEKLSSAVQEKSKVEEQQTELGNEIAKLKDALTIRNQEFEEVKLVENQLKQSLSEVNEAMELAQRHNEEYKLNEARIMSDCRMYQDNIENMKSSNDRGVEMLERKIQSLQSECLLLKNEKSSLSADYESYKVRVHSVLKQQKDRDARDRQTSIEAGELQQCQSTLEKVKLKLHEAQNNLHARNSELELVQADLNRLSQQHSSESERASEREVRWKSRVKELQNELQTVRKQHSDLTAKIDERVTTLQLAHDEELHNMKLSHDHFIEQLQDQLQQKESEILQLKTDMKKSQRKVSSTPVKSTNRIVTPTFKPQKSENSSSHVRSHSQHLDFRSLTREEGEGQENPEQLSPVASFEQILNTSDPIRSISMVSETKSVKSDTHQQKQLEVEFETQRKKLEHLSEVLRESEATVAQFVDQNKVLKEEIRRLEKNQERQTSVSSMEYLKNILYKFVTLPPSDERKRLLPVLDTLLKFNPEEKSKLFELAQGESGAAEGQSSWSGYFQRWSGLQ